VEVSTEKLDETETTDIATDSDDSDGGYTSMEEDDYCSVYGVGKHCVMRFTMAGGGSHWYNYVLKKDMETGEIRLYEENQQSPGGYWLQGQSLEVKLVEDGYDEVRVGPGAIDMDKYFDLSFWREDLESQDLFKIASEPTRIDSEDSMSESTDVAQLFEDSEEEREELTMILTAAYSLLAEKVQELEKVKREKLELEHKLETAQGLVKPLTESFEVVSSCFDDIDNYMYDEKKSFGEYLLDYECQQLDEWRELGSYPNSDWVDMVPLPNWLAFFEKRGVHCDHIYLVLREERDRLNRITYLSSELQSSLSLEKQERDPILVLAAGGKMISVPKPSHFNAINGLIEQYKEATAEIAHLSFKGRGVIEYHMWAMLKDTPYSRGDVKLAGWNSKDDTNAARGEYCYAEQVRRCKAATKIQSLSRGILARYADFKDYQFRLHGEHFGVAAIEYLKIIGKFGWSKHVDELYCERVLCGVAASREEYVLGLLHRPGDVWSDAVIKRYDDLCIKRSERSKFAKYAWDAILCDDIIEVNTNLEDPWPFAYFLKKEGQEATSPYFLEEEESTDASPFGNTDAEGESDSEDEGQCYAEQVRRCKAATKIQSLSRGILARYATMVEMKLKLKKMEQDFSVLMSGIAGAKVGRDFFAICKDWVSQDTLQYVGDEIYIVDFEELMQEQLTGTFVDDKADSDDDVAETLTMTIPLKMTEIKLELEKLDQDIDVLMCAMTEIIAGESFSQDCRTAFDFIAICKDYYSQDVIESVKECSEAWGMMGKCFYYYYSDQDANPFGKADAEGESHSEDEGQCYDGKACQLDEFGHCVHCCECKQCIKLLEEEEASTEINAVCRGYLQRRDYDEVVPYDGEFSATSADELTSTQTHLVMPNNCDRAVMLVSFNI
jgi:hypothetical protein